MARQVTRMRGLFVTGTDTGVGKTRVASAIVADLASRGLAVGALKAVATGADWIDGHWRSDDVDALVAALGRSVPRERVAPLVFEAPLAPPVAARLAGEPLAFDRVFGATAEAIDWWAGPGGADLLVVEGVGGLLCPIAEGATVADLAVALDYPLLVVAHRGLGTLNHTLLTVGAAQLRGLRVAGVVLNGARPTVDPIAERTNLDELSKRLTDVPILAVVPHLEGASTLPLSAAGLDWNGRVAAPRTLGMPSAADLARLIRRECP